MRQKLAGGGAPGAAVLGDKRAAAFLVADGNGHKLSSWYTPYGAAWIGAMLPIPMIAKRMSQLLSITVLF